MTGYHVNAGSVVAKPRLYAAYFDTGISAKSISDDMKSHRAMSGIAGAIN